MVELAEIRRVAEDAARRIMTATAIKAVTVEPDLGIDGDETLRVRIVVPDGSSGAIDSNQFFNASVTIKRAVRALGEDRRPQIGFITPEGLAELADPEP